MSNVAALQALDLVRHTLDEFAQAAAMIKRLQDQRDELAGALKELREKVFMIRGGRAPVEWVPEFIDTVLGRLGEEK